MPGQVASALMHLRSYARRHLGISGRGPTSASNSEYRAYPHHGVIHRCNIRRPSRSYARDCRRRLQRALESTMDGHQLAPQIANTALLHSFPVLGYGLRDR